MHNTEVGNIYSTGEGGSSYSKRNQQLLNNLYKQVKDTLDLIDNFLQENLAEKFQPVTYQEYLTIMSNAIID